MATTQFDGPFSTPMREGDRFQNPKTLFRDPARVASGGLSDAPPSAPNPLRTSPGAQPFKNLTNGR